jgi:hypothetical protein
MNFIWYSIKLPMVECSYELSHRDHLFFSLYITQNCFFIDVKLLAGVSSHFIYQSITFVELYTTQQSARFIKSLTAKFYRCLSSSLDYWVNEKNTVFLNTIRTSSLLWIVSGSIQTVSTRIGKSSFFLILIF